MTSGNKHIIFLIDSTLELNIRAFKTIHSLCGNFNITVLSRSSKPKQFDIKNVDYIKIETSIQNFFKRTLFLGNDFKNGVIANESVKNINEVDLIFAADLWALDAAVELKTRFKKALIFDSYELCVETIEQYYPTVSVNLKSVFFKFWIKYTKRIARIKEQNLLSEVDQIITTNESYARALTETYGVEGVEQVLNCPLLKNEVCKIDLHERFKIPYDKQIVLYIGWFNKGRYLPRIIESAEFLSDEYHLLLLGTGNLSDELKHIAKLHQNVTVAGPFEMVETLPLIKGATLGVLLLESGNKSKHLASANKLFEFLMAEIPMLLSNSPENKKMADISPLHSICYDLEPKGIAQAINRYKPEVINREYLMNLKQEFSWQNQERKLLEIVNRVI